VPGAWIKPNAVSAQDVVATALACPSGAITYERIDGGPQEAAPPVNVIRIRENGPLAIHADLRIGETATRLRATLCRCGASKNKPYCDGAHVAANFTSSGEPPAQPSEPLAARDGVVVLTPKKDGPLYFSGNLELVSGTGRTVNRLREAWLCRCGRSNNKPYCDGTHKKTGFRSD
jgi:CDGSH-type Zn-finger protein